MAEREGFEPPDGIATTTNTTAAALTNGDLSNCPAHALDNLTPTKGTP